MMRPALAALISAALQLLPSSELHGQISWGASLGATAGTVELLLDAGVDGVRRSQLQGIGYGFEGQLRAGPVEVDFRYFEADMEEESGSGESSDFVEGSVLAGVRVHRWVRADGGLAVHRIVDEAGSRRVLGWRGGMTVDLPVFRETVVATARVFGAVSGSSNLRGTYRRGGGGEAGIRFAPAWIPAWGAIRYSLARNSFQAGSDRIEEVDLLTLSLGIQLP